jgi:hypothetical protein
MTKNILLYLKGTFKVQKSGLIDKAYDINQISDKIFYFNSKIQEYVPLTNDVYARIQNVDFNF